MATLYTHQSSNIAKTWVLFAGFLVFIIAIGFVFSQAYGDPSILYFAVAFSLIMNLISYWHSDKVALALTGAKPADEKEYQALHRLVENLAITAGLPKPKVYIINDSAPNAFATGRNKEHAVVAVTAGLLSLLDRTELEGVIAHELSHIGNRDILISTVAVVLAGSIAILSDFFLRFSFWDGTAQRALPGGGRDGRSQAGAVLALVGLIMAILAPVAALLIRLAISRKREFLADASGALLTRYPEGLASALEKLHAYSKPMLRASGATAHLFIADPFGRNTKKFLINLFQTHPPVADRIKVLRSF